MFAGISLMISSVGLNRILAFSVPVLNAIYPVAIVLIALAFLNPLLSAWKRGVPCAILFTGTVSALYALEQSGALTGALVRAVGMIAGAGAGDMAAGAMRRFLALVGLLPGYEAGLGWILPAAVGVAVGILMSHGGGGKASERS